VIPTQLILLAIVIIAFWIYRQTSEEIPTILAAIAGSVCAIAELILAPWSIQLFVVLVLVSFNWQSQPHQRFPS
jgi:hypothetical protein